MKIYYSRSNEVDDSKVLPLITQLIENLPNYGEKVHKLTYHKIGSTYKPELVDEADIIIVGSINENGHIRRNSIAKGCFSELERAFNKNKPVLIIKEDDHRIPFVQNILSSDISIKNKNNWGLGYGEICNYDSHARPTGNGEGSYTSRINIWHAVDIFMCNIMSNLNRFTSIGKCKVNLGVSQIDSL